MSFLGNFSPESAFYYLSLMKLLLRAALRMVQLLLLSFLTLFVGASSANSQDASKIVDQYVKAVGGSRALSQIRTLSIEGSLTASDGKTGTYTLDAKLPNRYYLELKIGDRSLLESYNGKSAWRQLASAEPATLLGKEGLQLEAAAQYYNSRLLNLKKNKIVAALIGNSKVQGQDAIQIDLINPAGVKRNLFFNPQTHLIVKESALVGGVNQEIYYGDYRPVDGIQLPHKIELHHGEQKYDVTVNRAVINGTVGERVFDFPRKSQIQLPDLKSLFKEIDDNQKAVDKIKENYTGTRIEEETEFESDGKVKKNEVNEFTFFYLNGQEISTLLKKDGKPLSAGEEKKENERTQKHIAEAQKQEAKKEAREEKAREQGKSDEKDEPGIEIFLRACQFVNPRRERFRGQDVLVFDFEGNPEFKARTLPEKVVQKLAGVVWIDEKAHDVARLEAYFVGDMKFAGGLLANLQKGTSFTFEQSYVNNEVWLPTYEEAHIGVRVLLVKGIKVNVVTRYSDYKRFNVETLSTIAKPKAAESSPEVPQKPDSN